MASGKAERERLLLGAHVSTAGGLELAPARGAAIGAAVIQVFTKQVNRWAERRVDDETAAAFRTAMAANHIVCGGSHDSYLINLASPNRALRDRSFRSFCHELERCRTLGLDFLVTHPGNATDGDREAGLRRNASAVRRALRRLGGDTLVLFESTAGQGTSLGASFAELASLLDGVGDEFRHLLGICLDTAHLLAAGYDIVGDYDGVMNELDRQVGLERVRLFHLNDSRTSLASRVDRHAEIGAGYLGLEPFRRIMRDARFFDVPKLIETPKGDDPVVNDRKNLQRLRHCATTSGHP